MELMKIFMAIRFIIFKIKNIKKCKNPITLENFQKGEINKFKVQCVIDDFQKNITTVNYKRVFPNNE